MFMASLLSLRNMLTQRTFFDIQDIDNAGKDAKIRESGTEVLKKLWKDDPQEVWLPFLNTTLSCTSMPPCLISGNKCSAQDELQSMFADALIQRTAGRAQAKPEQLIAYASWACLMLQVTAT